MMKKFPLFIQHDSMQCGIACLCMICKFFGRSISIETMANLCHAFTFAPGNKFKRIG